MLYGRRNKCHEINGKLDEIHSDLSQISKTISAEKIHPNYAKRISVISGAAGLIGLLENGINYLNDFQYCRYWSIPTRFIKVSGSGDIGRFFIVFIIGFIHLIPCYWILDNIYDKFHLIRSDKIKVNKIKSIFITILLFILLCFIYACSILLIFAISGVADYGKGYLFTLVLPCLTILWVIIEFFDFYKLKKQKKLKISEKGRKIMARDKEINSEQYTKWIKFTLVSMFSFLLISYVCDLFITRVQTEFDIVEKNDKTYAVLYVSGDSKIMKECVVSGDNIVIDLNNTYISNEPVKFETMNFIGNVTRSYYGVEKNRFDEPSINDMM